MMRPTSSAGLSPARSWAIASFRRDSWSLTRIDPLLSTTRTILRPAVSSCAVLVVAATTIATATATIVVERLPEPIRGRSFQGCRLRLMASLWRSHSQAAPW